ncbi:gamma carbonic anhydrase family protein [Cellulomonas aerilata]|uniref:Gamma carbonic anhydrase family protein n=1 Tax=Cellulomonas aerilata TaxID=515326 RepID=A0A512D8R4_9CELL|nr:gamma carbonic anhydrase family protein [Cellulomonas aerilata]GEO32785.1 gamma carbonic anhydrase family protein [Cellulomonas aerilata]
MTDGAGVTPAVVLRIGERVPVVAADAWVAPGAVLVGDVRLGSRASVWYGCVLRADGARIEVGDRSNLQDGTIAHADEHGGVVVGADVSVGHRAVLHGCTVGDGSLVGMGAVLLTGSRVGAESLVAAGAVVREGMEIPPRSLVAGVPAVVRRPLSDDELERLRVNALTYLDLTAVHRSAQALPTSGDDRDRA